MDRAPNGRGPHDHVLRNQNLWEQMNDGQARCPRFAAVIRIRHIFASAFGVFHEHSEVGGCPESRLFVRHSNSDPDGRLFGGSPELTVIGKFPLRVTCTIFKCTEWSAVESQVSNNIP